MTSSQDNNLIQWVIGWGLKIVSSATPGVLLIAVTSSICSAVKAQEFDAIAGRITEDRLHGHIRFLSDDLLEGRGPASMGDLLTQLYLESQFRGYGLQKFDSLDGYRQNFPMIGLTSTPEPRWVFRDRKDRQNVAEFQYFADYIAVAGTPAESTNIEDSEVVFVGFGIQAPEYQWDDYKGVDLRGKILLMLNNDPESDPGLFGGTRRLYYGRWDYKYASAARQGAAGAILIHTDESAGYPFSVVQTSWTGEEFELSDSAAPRLSMKAWLTKKATDQLLSAAGLDLADLLVAAETREFQPIPLGVSLSTTIRCQARSSQSANVMGVLSGSDPALADQYIVLMAHHDHIGISDSRDERGDNIYNGAIDNASGTAALLTLAESFSCGPRPRRSLLFAAVGAEEQGLLGSKYFAQHPPVPHGKLSAVINMDGANFLGPTRDVHVIGFGKSSLDNLVQAVAERQSRLVVPDRQPSRGYYYRSDQFSLAQVGVPGVYLHSGYEVIGKPDGWGKEQLDAWTKQHYHQRSDEYNPNWDLSGAVQDLRLLAEVCWLAANQDDMQSWNPGDEFEAARKAALQEIRSP